MAEAAPRRKRQAKPGRRSARPPRAGRQAERRRVILAAALGEFSARGFAAARLDDIAEAAGIAKGTIYLYFRDKEALFQDLIRSEMSPVADALEAALAIDLPLRAVAEHAVELFVREVYGTSRRDIIRLILTEGPRFPKLADFYYREVLSRIVTAVRRLLERARARGELHSDTLIHFPQLLGAPGIVAILWSGLFERQAPLDVRSLMRAHLDILLGEGKTR
ncbi:MAG TPA: helix-turn-helix domain-containing protein [Xanthobacteraceae bacterium]|nr:helix-turn-helix domain-containing protein [Xanthobacteraceae bacterium]